MGGEYGVEGLREPEDWERQRLREDSRSGGKTVRDRRWCGGSRRGQELRGEGGWMKQKEVSGGIWVQMAEG